MRRALERLRSRRRRHGLAGDEGTSMMELVVGMSIMTLFMAMFTGAVLMMTGTANKVESVTSSANQVNQAFLRLDRLVRYASAISPPAQAGSAADWYVELRLTNTGTERCTQLRVDNPTQQLQLRTWSVNSSGVASAASAWLPIADGITNGTAAGTPFVAFVTRTSLYQQLTINLTSTATGVAASTSSNTATFTALNSSANSTGPVCQQWGRP